MSDEPEDFFKPRPGRIRNAGGKRAKRFVNRVLHRMSAFGGKGQISFAGSNRFTGTRIGRGNAVMQRRSAGGRFGPAYRRVVIKSRIAKLSGAKSGKGIGAARAHLRYIQRDGVSKEHEPGQLYDAEDNHADGNSFLKRSEGDRHQFRFIVSPEDGSEFCDLKPFIRDLMKTMEDDLGTRLDWVAVDHFNTEHPHTHIVLRGKDDTGKDLIIARDYMSQGMRRRASELLTVELGPQTEIELRRDLQRQIEQHRYTDIDRMLEREADGGLLDVRRDLLSTGKQGNGAMRIGRLRVLEKLGLAREEHPGRWQLAADLEGTLRRLGERGDIIKTMHRALKDAGIDAGASNYSIYDPADPRAPVVTGAVLDTGLHDELNDGHYALIDSSDGRIHHVVLNPEQDMDDLPKGAVIEVQPAERGARPSDRKIADVARANDGLYSADAHRIHDPSASAEYVRAHVRRLEALRRSNIVRRFSNGSWEIPDDFETRVSKLSEKKARYPGRVVTLSFLSIENQINANGATWLDRQLLSKDPVALRGSGFGSEASQALERRQEYLVEQGHAKRQGDTIRYQRNLLRVMRQRELSAAGNGLADQNRLEFVPLQDGERVDGVYRKPLRLASGKFAIIETSKEFTLVPWRPVLERHRGKSIGATLRGASVSFDFGKKRGIGV